MPHTCAKDWIDVLAALAPAVAVLVAIGIGAFQLYLQRQQVNQDLFQKRFTIYTATREFLTDFIEVPSETFGQVQAQAEVVIDRFLEKTAHVSFLFGDEIVHAREGMICTALFIAHYGAGLTSSMPNKYATYRDAVDRMITEPAEAVTEERAGDRAQLERHRADVNSLFSPYLQLYEKRNQLLRLVDAITWWVDSREDVLRT